MESPPILESEVRPESITFMARKQKQDSYFDVTNKGEMHQMYKLKTNNNKEYKISPNMFALGLNERKRIFVTFLGHTDKPAKDRISVVFLHYTNGKVSVEHAWSAAKGMHNTPEKRAYVNILFKEDQRRSISEVNEKEKSQVGNKSQTAKPGSSRMEPSSSAGRDDSYYGVPQSGVAKVAKGTVRKRGSGTSNCSTEPSEDTNEEPNNRSAKKKGVSQSVEATEEGDTSTPPPPKPRSRRKASVPPRSTGTEEEDEAPTSPVTKTVIPAVRRKKSPARTVPVAVTESAEPADDEMAEAPIAPKTTKTRKQQPIQQEEEEDEAPPPPKPAGKPRSRRKNHTTPPPRPSTNDEDTQLGAKKVTSPVRTPRAKSSNPKPRSRRKTSGSADPLQSILASSPQIIYILPGDRTNDEEEDSDKKTRKKSKKSKKRKEEDEEVEE